jgi:hypothetical protein
MAPRIFNLGTRWRRVVSFTPRALCSNETGPQNPLDRRMGLDIARAKRTTLRDLEVLLNPKFIPADASRDCTLL